MKNRLTIEIPACLLVFLHLYAGITKVAANDVFGSQLKMHAVIGGFSEVLAIGVPVIEIIVGIMLLIRRTFIKALVVSLVLLSVFTIYLAVMIAFQPHLPCACGGVIGTLTWPQHLVFNAFFYFN